MNPAFELVEETQTPVEILDPDEQRLRAEESTVVTITEPDKLKQMVELYQGEAQKYVPSDALTVRRCAAFLDTCKAAMHHAEKQRTDVTEPLNKKIREHNAIWQPIVKGFEAIVKTVGTRLAIYIDEEQKRVEAEQQKAIEEANKKQAELDRKAEEARQAAQTAQASGNTMEAVKLEGKAQRLELQAAQVAPVVVQQDVSRKIDLGGSTVSVKAPSDSWTLPGWDGKSRLYADDPLLQHVDMAWLRRFCIVDPVRLNAACKSGEEFPRPFTKTKKLGGSIIRRN